MPYARRLIVNPFDESSGWVLLTNGIINAFGSAPPVVGNPTWVNNPVGEPAMAFQLTNYASPAGYVLDFFGQVHAFGGVTAPSSQAPNSNPYPVYVDFVMDPAGTGKGYVLNWFGELYAIGGALPVTTGLSIGSLGRRVIRDPSSSWSAIGKFYVLDGYGGAHPVNGAPALTQAPYFSGNDVARDLVLTDWPNGRGYLLDSHGAVHPVGGAPESPGFPYFAGDVATDLSIPSLSPLIMREVVRGGGTYRWIQSSAPTVIANAQGTWTDTTKPTMLFLYADVDNNPPSTFDVAIIDEADWTAHVQHDIQDVTLGGTPTAGSFKLIMEGHATGNIAYNASASTVQTALAALPGCAGVTVTKPSAFVWRVTWGGQRQRSRQPLMDIDASVTGATSTTITRNQSGLNWFNQIDTGGITPWARATLTDATIRSWTPTLYDAGTYIFMVRATDSTGRVSGIMYDGFAIDITTPPPIPTLTVTVFGGILGQRVNAAFATPDLPTPDPHIEVQYSDDGGTVWHPLQGNPYPAASSPVQVLDTEAPFTKGRKYRARIFRPDPYLAGLWSTAVTGTLTKPAWVLSNPFADLLQLVIHVNGLKWGRPTNSFVAKAEGDDLLTVITDESGIARTGTLSVRCDGRTVYDSLTKFLLEPRTTPLLLRSPFGDCWYIKITDINENFIHASPRADENPAWGVRWLVDLDISFAQVARPAELEQSSTLFFVPAS